MTNKNKAPAGGSGGPLVLLAQNAPHNSRACKILAVANLAGVPLTMDPDFALGDTNEQPAYLDNCHPMGRTPVLRTDDGFIFESNSIIRYIARIAPQANLYGFTNDANKSGGDAVGARLHAESQVDMWLDYMTNEVESVAPLFMMQDVMGVAKDAKQNEEAMARIHSAMNGLEIWLSTRTFLVNERLSIADVSIAFGLQWVYQHSPEGAALTTQYGNVYRLYNTVMHQQPVVDALVKMGAGIGPK